MRLLVAVMSGLALVGTRVSADPVCSAHVTVREVGRQANDDGTRTLKYRATVLAEPAEGASCARVSFSVMRSYVKADGSTTEGAIPVTIEAKKRNTTVDGEDVLATSRLVYWWTDQVRCEPCSGEAAAAPPAAGKARSEAGKARTEARPDKDDKTPPKGRKKAAAALGAVALGALLLL